MTARTATGAAGTPAGDHRLDIARPGARAWSAMIRSEGRLVSRDTAGLLLPIGVPVLFMVMNGLGSDREPIPAFGGMTVLDAMVVPATVVMILAMLGLINVPSFLATHRQYGVLRRLSTTPAGPAMVMVAQVAVNLTLGAIGVAAALIVAATAFGLAAPANLGFAILVTVLGAAALYATGLLVAAVAPTANAALAIGLVAFFAMMAAGGGMMPAERLPAVVARIGEYTPFGAMLHALRASWLGETPSAIHLVVLVAITVLSVGLATRVFRWD